MRLQKFLSQAGVASRRKAEEWIKLGKIKVNGNLVKEMGLDVSEKDKVEYNGKAVKLEPKKIYLALNKPEGYIASSSDSQGRTVMALVGNIKQRIYPVGRLDKDSSGLIVLTNDGELADHLTHPRYEKSKEYVAVLDKEPSIADLKKISQGLVLEKKLQPVEIVDVKGKSARLIIHEGVNRQIRRMFAQLGYTVLKLKRIRVGNLELGELKPGEWREVKKEEKAAAAIS